MKKIINGKKYDTDTAREVGSDCGGGQSFRDFHYWEETLYCKRTGEYFLFGEGGPMTQYAEQIEQNSWSGGSKIMPLDYKAAKAWAEEHMDADDYEEEFGAVSEDETKVVLSLSVSAAVADKARKAAQAAGISLSELVAQAIEKY